MLTPCLHSQPNPKWEAFKATPKPYHPEFLKIGGGWAWCGGINTRCLVPVMKVGRKARGWITPTFSASSK